MKGARVAVVGASSGIGRAVAAAARAAGADVVAAARRADALAGLIGAHAVVADVTTAAGRAAVVEACAERLGGIDLLVQAAGRADLRRVADTGDDVWRATFETNVVAYNRLVAAALPLLAPPAIVAVLSSESAAAPRSGLVAYAASKAALETSARGWQVEHPGLRFSVRCGLSAAGGGDCCRRSVGPIAAGQHTLRMPSATLSRWPVVIGRPVGADDVDDDGRLTDVACERIDAPSTQGGGTVAMRGVHQRVSGDAPGAGFSDVRDPEAPGGSP